MAAKAKKKSSTKKKARKKKVARKKPGPLLAPKSSQGVRIPDEIRSLMWVLREEGHSIREIAKRVDVAVRSVSVVFAEDPGKYAALISALREERARLWQQVEATGLKSLVELMEAGREALFTKDGKLQQKRLKVCEKRFLTVGPRWAQIFRHAADSGTRQSQLLLGQPTDILQAVETSAAAELGDDALIEQAIEYGLVDRLPATLRQRALAQMEEKDGPASKDREADQSAQDHQRTKAVASR